MTWSNGSQVPKEEAEALAAEHDPQAEAQSGDPPDRDISLSGIGDPPACRSAKEAWDCEATVDVQEGRGNLGSTDGAEKAEGDVGGFVLMSDAAAAGSGETLGEEGSAGKKQDGIKDDCGGSDKEIGAGKKEQKLDLKEGGFPGAGQGAGGASQARSDVGIEGRENDRGRGGSCENCEDHTLESAGGRGRRGDGDAVKDETGARDDEIQEIRSDGESEGNYDGKEDKDEDQGDEEQKDTGPIRTLFVNGLPYETRPQDLFNLFRFFPGFQFTTVRAAPRSILT